MASVAPARSRRDSRPVVPGRSEQVRAQLAKHKSPRLHTEASAENAKASGANGTSVERAEVGAERECESPALCSRSHASAFFRPCSARLTRPRPRVLLDTNCPAL